MRIESQKLRQSAKGQHCTLRLDGCLPGTETVVLCHVPGVTQRGWGLKAPDFMAAFGCMNCHDIIDGRKRGNWTYRDVLRAMCETQMVWVETGLIKIEGMKR